MSSRVSRCEASGGTYCRGRNPSHSSLQNQTETSLKVIIMHFYFNRGLMH